MTSANTAANCRSRRVPVDALAGSLVGLRPAWTRREPLQVSWHRQLHGGQIPINTLGQRPRRQHSVPGQKRPYTTGRFHSLGQLLAWEETAVGGSNRSGQRREAAPFLAHTPGRGDSTRPMGRTKEW